MVKPLLILLLAAILVAPAFAQQANTRAQAIAREYPPLPENIIRQQITIWSDGTRMAGDLHFPKDLEPEAKLPAILFIAGTGGTKKGTPAHMRYNTAKGIGYNAVEAAEKIKIPMLIIDAENEEPMDTSKNGKAVAETLKKNNIPVTYRIIEGISHYGIYKEKFQEATAMEIEFFDEHLKK